MTRKKPAYSTQLQFSSGIILPDSLTISLKLFNTLGQLYLPYVAYLLDNRYFK